MKTLHFDCFAGISGDMALGALVELGVDPDLLRGELAKLGLGGWSLDFRREERRGITGTRALVKIGGSDHHDHHDHDHDHHDHHEHDHHEHEHHGHDHHEHGHNSWKEIRRVIEKSALGGGIKNRAVDIFRRIAEAESAVHGVKVEEITFHEVGALDSIIDIVGTAVCLEVLAPGRITSSAIELGGGTVRCAHGVLPVPAPATLRLCEGLPVTAGGFNQEMTTPTGAAILASVVDEFVSGGAVGVVSAGADSGVGDGAGGGVSAGADGGVSDNGNAGGGGSAGSGADGVVSGSAGSGVDVSGGVGDGAGGGDNGNAGSSGGTGSGGVFIQGASAYGIGSRNPERANVLRVSWRETTSVAAVEGAGNPWRSEELIQLEAAVDDMTGEALGFLMDRLFASGALDAAFIPCVMKKSRPGTIITVLCGTAALDSVRKTLFVHSSTLGFREIPVTRLSLPRKEEILSGPFGKVRQKTAELAGPLRGTAEGGFPAVRTKIDFEDRARIARERNITLDEAAALAAVTREGSLPGNAEREPRHG